MIGNFNDVAEASRFRFEESPLGKKVEGIGMDQIDDIDDHSLAFDLDEVSEECCDDNGRQYRTEEGKLLPNNTYELNGNVYTTDDHGRIIRCEATPKLSPENPRDLGAQQEVGGEDRRPTDQGGHIVGRDMNGDSGIGNLIAMDSKINQSDYKRMENDIKADLEEGKEVTTTTEITYSDDSDRPDKITVTVTSDGKVTVYKFDNNLDGSLMDDVPENGKEDVEELLNKTNGEISSITKEYDENGNLVATTVYITYKDENGNNRRVSIEFSSEDGVATDNSQGGKS